MKNTTIWVQEIFFILEQLALKDGSFSMYLRLYSNIDIQILYLKDASNWNAPLFSHAAIFIITKYVLETFMA